MTVTMPEKELPHSKRAYVKLSATDEQGNPLTFERDFWVTFDYLSKSLRAFFINKYTCLPFAMPVGVVPSAPTGIDH